jgi:hypothetical protein
MGVMNEAVEDGVGIGWITDDIVPAVDGKLACDDGGAAAIALGASARASGYHDHPHEAPGIHRSRRPPVTGERPRLVIADGRLDPDDRRGYSIDRTSKLACGRKAPPVGCPARWPGRLGR